MKRKIPFTRQQSIGLRIRLEDHLTKVFANNTIDRYKTLDEKQPELQLVANNAWELPELPCIRSAYHIWLHMYTADRHAVLAKFQCLCTDLQITGKTFVFCALFIHEFAHILTAAMEWPD